MVERVLVVVPTYDERENLGPVSGRLLAVVPAAHLLVVDDASPDGTGELADALAAGDPRVHVLHRAGKEGLGAAYLAGFAWALARGYDVVVEMDADGSHAPEQLPRLLERLSGDDGGGGADVVLGSRWVPGGRAVGWPLRRRLVSRGGNLYARLALGLPLRDSTGGFRAYRADLLRSLPLRDVASQGYCFQVDMAWRAWRTGAVVAEVPITFVERVHGVSKMDDAIVREALWRVTAWGLGQRWARRRLARQLALPGGDQAARDPL